MLALDAGDYTGSRVADVLRIERKSLPDFLGCVGSGRARFERHLKKLAAYELPYLVLEFTLEDLANHVWRNWHLGGPGIRKTTRQIKITPSQALGSVVRWSQKYKVQPLFCGKWDGSGRVLGQALVQRLVELAEKEAPPAGQTGGAGLGDNDIRATDKHSLPTGDQ